MLERNGKDRSYSGRVGKSGGVLAVDEREALSISMFDLQCCMSSGSTVTITSGRPNPSRGEYRDDFIETYTPLLLLQHYVCVVNRASHQRFRSCPPNIYTIAAC